MGSTPRKPFKHRVISNNQVLPPTLKYSIQRNCLCTGLSGIYFKLAKLFSRSTTRPQNKRSKVNRTTEPVYKSSLLAYKYRVLQNCSWDPFQTDPSPASHTTTLDIVRVTPTFSLNRKHANMSALGSRPVPGMPRLGTYLHTGT